MIHRWSDFRFRLREALHSPRPSETVEALLHSVLVADNSADDLDAIRWIVERMDVEALGGGSLLVAAQRVEKLMGDVSDDAALDLLELVLGQDRLCAIAGKYRKGVVSRTSLLSFASEQRWPPDVRSRVGALADSGLDELCAALSAGNYRAVAELLAR